MRGSFLRNHKDVQIKMYSLVFLLMLSGSLVFAGQMKTVYSWSQVDFTFSSEQVRSEYLANRQFIPENNVIIDVDVYPGSEGVEQKVFVTLPRLKEGTPVTLALVTELNRNNTRLLQPYPDWSWHSSDTCDGITSVFRTKIDECGRFWVLDTGVVNSFVAPKRKCPPQLLIFDLKTDKLIKRHVFPDSFVTDATLPITVVVDTRNNDCSGSFAYVADVTGFKLWVYDLANDKSWQISNNLFYPNPFHGDFHINGDDFELMDGIFGLALGPVTSAGDRTLHFHSFSSVTECHVSCSVVRNNSLFSDNAAASPRAFQAFKHSRSSQAATQDTSSGNIVFFGLVEENAVGCWDANFPFEKEYIDIAAKNDKTLQFQSGLKVINEQVWTVSNMLQKYINNRLPVGETTQRINVGSVSELIHNTKCASRDVASRDLVSRLSQLTKWLIPSALR